MSTHDEREDKPWDIAIPDHPPRSDSPEYVRSRARLHELTGAGTYYGAPPIQDHHGGGLWVHDETGWFMVRNLAGMEWSSQFCADPAKVDQLRQNARRLYAGFPGSAEYLGIRELLDTPITDAAGVEAWTDSICNASVPLPAALHTGCLPKSAGYHHYPAPIVEIQTFKRDDFQLFVTDDEGHPAAVVPVAPRGTGDGRVHVLWTHPASMSVVARSHRNTQANGQRLVLSGEHDMAKQAFAGQG